MRVSEDIIGDLIDRVIELLPEQHVQTLQKVEIEARHAYGGTRVYVLSSRAVVERRRVVELIADDRPVQEQAAELGLHRATIYRHLKRRRTN